MVLTQPFSLEIEVNGLTHSHLSHLVLVTFPEFSVEGILTVSAQGISVAKKHYLEAATAGVSTFIVSVKRQTTEEMGNDADGLKLVCR